MRTPWADCTRAYPTMRTWPRSTRSRCSGQCRAASSDTWMPTKATARRWRAARSRRRWLGSSTGCCVRTRSIRVHSITSCTTTTTRSTRASRSRRRGHSHASRPIRATRGTCRRTSSCSSDSGATPPRRIGRRLLRRRRGSRASTSGPPCATTTRSRGCSTSCCSWGGTATRGRRSITSRQSSKPQAT